MSLKIENIEVYRNKSTQMHDFLIALNSLEIGQSFVIGGMVNNFRIILSSTDILCGKKFMTKKEGDKYRIGRMY